MYLLYEIKLVNISFPAVFVSCSNGEYLLSFMRVLSTIFFCVTYKNMCARAHHLSILPLFTLKLIYVNLRRVMFGVETQSTNYSKREPRIYSTLTRKHTEVVSARVSILIMQKLRSIV